MPSKGAEIAVRDKLLVDQLQLRLLLLDEAAQHLGLRAVAIGHRFADLLAVLLALRQGLQPLEAQVAVVKPGDQRLRPSPCRPVAPARPR